MKLDKLGWIVAAGLLGGMISMGFQGTAPKFATVDMEKVFTEADITKTNNDDLHAAQRVRESVLQFLQENQVMKPDDAEKYATLSVKSPKSAADQAELDRITKDALFASNKQRELATKAAPTPDDMKALNVFSANGQQNNQSGNRLKQTFVSDLQKLEGDLRDKSLAKVRQVIRDVANKEGYTVVFSQDSAPFAANDLTADALKAVKKS